MYSINPIIRQAHAHQQKGSSFFSFDFQDILSVSLLLRALICSIYVAEERERERESERERERTSSSSLLHRNLWVKFSSTYSNKSIGTAC